MDSINAGNPCLLDYEAEIYDFYDVAFVDAVNYDDCVYYTNKKANTNIDDELSWQQHYQSTWFLWNPRSCGNEGAFMCQPSNI